MRKLKDPLKYIKRLKGQIKWLDEVRERLLIENNVTRGSHWFNWKDPVKKETGFLYASIDGLKPGTEIVMVGRITEIHQTLAGNTVVMEFTEVRTRKP